MAYSLRPGAEKQGHAISRFPVPDSSPDPGGGNIGSSTEAGVPLHRLVIMAFSSRLAVSIGPSIFIRSDVRIKAKSVAVKVTVPSAFNGMFIATNRWKHSQPKAVNYLNFHFFLIHILTYKLVELIFIFYNSEVHVEIGQPLLILLNEHLTKILILLNAANIQTAS